MAKASATGVRAADVEQPGDRIERGDHHGIVAAAVQPGGDIGALVRRCSPGSIVAMDFEPRGAGLRTALPDAVDGVARHRHEFGAAGAQQFGGGFHPAAGMQPRVITDAVTLRSMVGEPLRGAGFRHVLIFEQIAWHLFAHLQRVTAIGEDRGALADHRRRASRPGKAGQPFESLGIAADIFAHMFVGQGYDKTGQPVGGELGVKRFQPVLDGGHWQYSF
jgi:hypothetical protein